MSNAMCARITVKNGEAKNISFTVTRGGVALDLTTAIPSFNVSDADERTALISKDISAFDMTDASDGIIIVNIDEDDLDVDNIPPGDYVGELKIVFTADTDIDISHDIDFIVGASSF